MISSVYVKSLYGFHDIHVQFHPGLNVVHGKNGSGKTTLLHIVANLLSRDTERFCHVAFDKIVVRTFGGRIVQLEQSVEADKKVVSVQVDGKLQGKTGPGEQTSPELNSALSDVFGSQEPVYLPAFRSILEAVTRHDRFGYVRSEISENDPEYQLLSKRLAFSSWATQRSRTRLQRGDLSSAALKTLMCRRWFGQFVPLIRYPSLWDVAREIEEELEAAYIDLARTDQRALSTVFVKVLEAVFSKAQSPGSVEDTKELLESVRKSLDTLNPGARENRSIYSQVAQVLQQQSIPDVASIANLRAVLEVYQSVLYERGQRQEEAFSQINRFRDSVNVFLEGKRLDLGDVHSRRPRDAAAAVVHIDNDKGHSLDVLSSGERHVLTLLFSATHMSKSDGAVLIDEPELSLHIDWQRTILTELMRLADSRQIIACTHSPEVAAEHRHTLTKITSHTDRSRQAELADILDPGESDSEDVKDAS